MTSLRLVKEEDRKLLFKWRNLPEIVENSLSQKTVSWEEHDQWFSKILADMFFYCLPFIIIHEKEPVGHIRFEAEMDDVCNLSIYLLEKYRNRKLGSEALEQGIKEVVKVWPMISLIIAYVKEGNQEGKKFFLNNNFLEDESEERRWTLFRKI